MSNMPYCRFENTLSDLQDCGDALYDDGLKDLSDSERAAAKELIELCASIGRWYKHLLEEDEEEEYEKDEDEG